jgi:predicted pyridoxine 5'-phosphate oxidase superfamily flavin-nucleotide-binding protein
LAEASASGTSGTGALPPEQATLVDCADTFFIATHHVADADDDVTVRSGNDVSHRGGAPGFVRAAAPGRLRWPDFVGNNFFNTLGAAWGWRHA